MKIRIVALGLQPPLTEQIYTFGEDYEVSNDLAVDFLNRSWAVPLKIDEVEKAVAEPEPETATGKRQQAQQHRK